MDDFDFVVGRLLDVFRVENSTEHGARVARLDDGVRKLSTGEEGRQPVVRHGPLSSLIELEMIMAQWP